MVSERARYRLKCRAQLVTADSRTNSYFAEDTQNGEAVFVKGPYLRQDQVDKPLFIQAVKRQLVGLHAVWMRAEMLLPDQFERADVPLGMQRHTNPEQAYPFLVMQDVLNRATYPSYRRESKLWKPTEVADFDRIAGYECPLPSKLPETTMRDYLLALAFRFVLEIPDSARRNFMWVDPAGAGRLYGIDEEDYFVTTDTLCKFAAAERKALIAAWGRHRAALSPILEQWRSPLAGHFAQAPTTQARVSGNLDALLAGTGLFVP